MVATPFSGVITFASGASVTFSADDVDGNFITFDDTGLDSYQPEGDQTIVDIALTAAGVDTTKLSVFRNGNERGVKLLDATLLASLEDRLKVPLTLQAGVRYQFKQQA